MTVCGRLYGQMGNQIRRKGDSAEGIMFLRFSRSGSGEGEAESRFDMSVAFFRSASAPMRAKLPVHPRQYPQISAARQN